MADFTFKGGRSTAQTKAAKKLALEQQRKSDFAFDSKIEGDKNWSPTKSTTEKKPDAQKLSKPQQKKNKTLFDVFNDVSTEIGRAQRDIPRGIVDKFSQGAKEQTVKAANFVQTGFDVKETNKRTEAFKQAEQKKADKNKKPENNSSQYKAGAAIGDFLSPTVADSIVKLKGQAEIGAAKKNTNTDAGLKKLQDDRKWQVKSGVITQAQADKNIAKYKSDLDKTKKSVKAAENKVGQKGGDDVGNTLAVVDVAASTAGLAGLTKTIFKKSVEQTTKKLGRELTKSEASDLAKKTKADSIARTGDAPTLKDKALASKPSEFLFGDKKVVQDAVQKVNSSEPRSTKYQIEVNKPRVSPVEATQKLKRAGYTTDESKKILEDVLPEKGLSMPGAPKKVGYKEDKILEAATKFDKTPPLGEIKRNQIIDETAAQYKSSEDYINEAVNNAWKDNKKGAGTNIIHKNLDESGVGSDAMKGTRVSENNPYYRAVFEETGRAPTKKRIREDITAFLDGKDNAARFLLHPDERGVVDLIKERETGLATNADVPEGVLPSDGSNVTPLAAKGTAEQGVSKLAASTKDEALKQKLIKKTQANTVDTPMYNKANMEQQAEYATNLIKTAPEDAVDIAMGRKAPPEHILQQMVYNAVEDHAKKIGGDKGANLLLQLSRSRQSTNLTKMGQEIRAAAERDPHSPVTMMDEVKLARAEAAKRRGKDLAKAVRADEAAIRKATPKVKKETWESFIKELEC